MGNGIANDDSVTTSNIIPVLLMSQAITISDLTGTLKILLALTYFGLLFKSTNQP